MSENNVINNYGKKSVFTVKQVLRVLSVLCTIFVFCPSFLVSCSGNEKKVNVMTAVEGIKVYDEYLVKPQPIMLICLLIPIATLALLFVKKIADKKNATIIAASTAVDLIIWFIFRSSAKKIAEENYCSFKTTPWYVINIFVLIIMFALSMLVILSKIEMEADLLLVFSNVTTNIQDKSQKENIPTEKYCQQCGNKLESDTLFCAMCGKKVD